MEKEFVLFQNKKDCCGCGACYNICPKYAISMEEDERGFIYPIIDHNKCFKCGLCKRTCAFQAEGIQRRRQKVYAAVHQSQIQKNSSASGGAFSALAEYVLDLGGVVYGAAFTSEFGVEHTVVDKIEDLPLLQGSKYVQSDMKNTYEDVKKRLLQDRYVLFSGTPCQIGGLYSYLKNPYDKLFTVDLICHGVPSVSLFKDYIHSLEVKYRGIVQEFHFRDKKFGWGLNGSVILKKSDGSLIRKNIYGSESSYYYLFLNSLNYRESCYHCKYASPNRVGNITVGDYWGIEKAHPELLDKFNVETGISVVMVNDDKGSMLIEKVRNNGFLIIASSEFGKAAEKNGQLNTPSKLTEQRETVLRIYQSKGYGELENWYSKKVGLKRYKNRVKLMIPRKMRLYIKKFF